MLKHTERGVKDERKKVYPKNVGVGVNRLIICSLWKVR